VIQPCIYGVACRQRFAGVL